MTHCGIGKRGGVFFSPQESLFSVFNRRSQVRMGGIIGHLDVFESLCHLLWVDKIHSSRSLAWTDYQVLPFFRGYSLSIRYLTWGSNSGNNQLCLFNLAGSLNTDGSSAQLVYSSQNNRGLVHDGVRRCVLQLGLRLHALSCAQKESMLHLVRRLHSDGLDQASFPHYTP